jgi:predicted amidophosphoribosyltransferase
MWYPATGERLVGGLVVRSAFRHDGHARLVVHQLKYRAAVGFTAELASAMVRLLPPETEVLVPIPRAHTRVLRYGVDPARELAQAVGNLAGLQVLEVIIRPWWAVRRAGKPVADRGRPRFRARRPPPGGIVLVDDVVTTGATLAAAAGVLSPRPLCAITATAA